MFKSNGKNHADVTYISVAKKDLEKEITLLVEEYRRKYQLPIESLWVDVGFYIDVRVDLKDETTNAEAETAIT